jgi:hypothetical protein
MDTYVQEVHKLESKFSGLEVHYVLREHNVGADILSKLGSTHAQVQPGVFIQELKQPSIKSSPQITIDAGPQQPDREVMTLGEDWREALVDFIQNQRLPAGVDARSAEAARIMRRSKGFVLVDGKLYRRGARSGVLMKCVTTEDGYDILREIHEGVCRQPRSFKNAGGESIQGRFLVAHCSDRRGGSRAHVPELSILRQAVSCSSPQPHHHTAILALCLLEPRHDWALHNGARRLHPCSGGYRQVYQVDRVQADSQAYTRSSC